MSQAVCLGPRPQETQCGGLLEGRLNSQEHRIEALQADPQATGKWEGKTEEVEKEDLVIRPWTAGRRMAGAGWRRAG